MIILLVLGALIVGGHALDKNPPRAGSDAVTPATLTEGAAEVGQVCDAQDLRQRDLTVPYTSRMPPALTDAKACDE